MNKYYFTFDANQETKDGMSLENCCVCIEADTIFNARFDMFDIRGSSWSCCYTENEFTEKHSDCGIQFISLDEVRIR